MPQPEQDTAPESLAALQAPDTDTQETSDTGSDSGEGETSDTSEEPAKLYAGKYKSAEELEAAYSEIQRFTGRRAELEAKATQYDRLVAQSASQTERPKLPKLSSFVTDDGTLDVASYDAAMDAYQTQRETVLLASAGDVATRKTREQADLERVEKDFPELVDDDTATKAIIALYRTGDFASIYEAASQINALKVSTKQAGKQEATAVLNHEATKKSRGTTVTPGSRVGRDTGEMTEEKFARMSRAEQSKYINENFKNALRGNK